MNTTPFSTINVTTTVFIFCADPSWDSRYFRYEPILSLSFSQAVAQGFWRCMWRLTSIAAILIMALAGCPDYFLHHPNYQVYSSVVVVLWSLQSFQVQQGTVSVFLDRALISLQAQYACKTRMLTRTCTKSSWTSIKGLIYSAQRFPRFCGMSACLSSPWRCHGATQLTCKVAAVSIYTRGAQSGLSLYLTLLIFSLFLISFPSFDLINYPSLPQTILFSDPPPSPLGSPIKCLVLVNL